MKYYKLNVEEINRLYEDFLCGNSVMEIGIMCDGTIGLDIIALQYLFCCLKHIENTQSTWCVMFVTDEEHGINDVLYFSLRSTLFLLLKYNPKMARKIKAVKDSGEIVSFVSTNSVTTTLMGALGGVGRIIPIIPVTQDTVSALNTVSWGKNKNDGSAFSNLLGVLRAYINKMNKFAVNNAPSDQVISMRDFVDQFKDTDTLLESIIFAATVFYTYDDGRSKVQNLEYDELELLHETCVDYAQGIYQLIENSYLHCMQCDEQKGCANFTVRIRKKDDALNLYVKHEKKNIDELKNVNHFLELYVTDLQYDQFHSLIEKFTSNVKERMFATKYRIVSNKFIPTTSKIRPFKKRGPVVDWGKKLSSVKLANLFTGEGVIDDYLSDPTNIALHYGLQILNNIVSVANGYLYVVSDQEYCNNNEMYIYKNIEWRNGTAYVIYLPLKFNFTDYLDTTAISYNNTASIVLNENKLRINWGYAPKNVAKDACIRQLMKQIIIDNPQCVGEKNYSDIYVVDCNQSNSSQFEIFAKTLFILLTKKETKFAPCHIALINVANRNEVIKLFRQFAMFYNRVGKNANMKPAESAKEEMTYSVYIVDKDAELDILLTSDLSTIKDDLYANQINGGLDEKTINILKNLVKGRV